MPVFWLRTLVNKITENKSAIRIRKQCAAFTVEYTSAAITEEIEELYTIYHSKIEFEAAERCRDYLEDPLKPNPFDSRMIAIRDGRKLIAVGKCLMLKKIDFAREQGIQYYYTGYLGTTETKFDYKLFPDKKAMEVLLAFDQQWVPWGKYDKGWLHGYFMDQVLGTANS
jgi:arginine-tRNA-protein transferase